MSPFVRAPASSANLGAGFDVYGMALDLPADVGPGPPPRGALAIDDHHPARAAFVALGGKGPLWLRSPIPMARGLGFSGAVRVAAAALGAVLGGRSLETARQEVLATAAELEGHGDNAAASVHGGIVAYVAADRILQLRVGPRLAEAVVVVWVPDSTTSTARSRRALNADVSRASAVFNIGRSVQFALAVERDDPTLFAGATADLLHQEARLALLPSAAAALDAGEAAGTWCGWLSGSGPTVAFLCAREAADDVARAMPAGGHVKRLAIDTRGVRVVEAG